MGLQIRAFHLLNYKSKNLHLGQHVPNGVGWFYFCKNATLAQDACRNVLEGKVAFFLNGEGLITDDLIRFI